MSGTYIPELIELNSYWQNAVEEAIQDTLKGEKRLYYALKNRKKIKQKLEKLGLKTKILKTGLREGRLHSCHGECNATRVREYPNGSFISVGEDFSQVVTDPEKSRSRSKTRGETPQKYRNPERPLLGDGSLEKMKKSQHDFNYEPMGMDEGIKSEEEEEEEKEEDIASQGGVKIPESDYNIPKKRIEWIHVRENSNFEDSNSEISNISKRMREKNDFNKMMGWSGGSVRGKNEKFPINFDPRGDLFWENEVKNAIRANANFERKLQLALAKREILNEHQAILRIEEGDNQIEIQESEAKNTEKKRRGKKFLSPFVRFYLDVYRELCLKCPMKEIGEEAARRWWNMTMKQKSDYPARKSKK